MFYDRNSPSAVLEWAWNALSHPESNITAEEHKKLYEIAVQCAAKGLWRGDVCDRWRDEGFGSGKIHDFYP